jgi:cullin-associated NEDD8-dissociated protein 1
MEHQELLERIIAGFKDEYDIKAICHLMITKLISLDPDETSRRLDALAPAFQSVLTTKLKENAVKQELEKLQEAVNEVLRTTARLNNRFPGAAMGSATMQAPIWKSYIEFIGKEYANQLKAAEEALKSEA